MRAIFAKFKEMTTMMREVKSQSISMQRRLTIYWLIIVLAFFVLSLLILSLTGVFSSTDKALCKYLEMQQQNTSKLLSDHMDSLTAQSVELSQNLTNELANTLVSNGKSFDDLNNNPDLIKELEKNLYTPLFASMSAAKCSGSFVILDASVNTKIKNSSVGLYLRYSDLRNLSSNKDMVYFRGVPDIAFQNHIQMHNRWNLEINTSSIPAYNTIMTTPVTRLANCGIWTDRIEIKDTWEHAILLLVPIVDHEGIVRGACGMEISDLYFRLNYPAIDSFYGYSDTLLSTSDNQKQSISPTMSSGIFTFPDDGYSIPFKKLDCYNSYTTENTTYFGLHQTLSAVSYNKEPFVVVTLLSANTCKDIASAEKITWIIGLSIILISMLALAHYLSKQFYNPISQLLSAIQIETSHRNPKSNISEIDELINYIQAQREKNPQEPVLPDNIREMLQAFSLKMDDLTATERNIFELYAQGLDTTQVAKQSFISPSTAQKHLNKIYKKLGLSSRGELILYTKILHGYEQFIETSKPTKDLSP